MRRDSVAGFFFCVSRWRRYKTRSSGRAGKGARRSAAHQATKQSRSAAIAALVASAIASSAVSTPSWLTGGMSAGSAAAIVRSSRVSTGSAEPRARRCGSFRLSSWWTTISPAVGSAILQPLFALAAASPLVAPSQRLFLP